MRLALLLAAAVVLTGASWIDPHATAREAARLYEKGDFEAATQKYNEALTDDPDSYLLQYNRGASLYRENKFEDAAAAFGRAPVADPAAPGEVAYNAANAKYRLGAAAAESDPQKALGLYAEALAAYRRAMGANPDDVDAKFNHELVEKKLEELRKKLEEQQQEQEQQQQEQQQSDQQQQEEQQESQPQEQQDQRQQPQDEQQQSAQQQPEPQGDEQSQQSDRQPQDQAAQQQEQQQERQQPGEEGEAGESQQRPESAVSAERREGEMTEHEARALLDAARDQEVRPDEIIERMQGATVLEPSQDW
jgi:Ca-activated chloride channel family protein